MPIKVFSCPFRITQKFGARPQYYKQFGLKGHEGLDCTPTCSDLTVFSLPYKGKVVKDIDMAEKGKNYGILTTIWYPEISEAWMYCHLSSNKVYEGQELPPSSPIGTMGATGNTTGPHLHLNRFKVDARGYRLNRDNGYLGGIDPLPFLMQDVGEQAPEAKDDFKEKGVEILDQYRTERIQGPEGNWESYARALMGSDKDAPELREKVAKLESRQLPAWAKNLQPFFEELGVKEGDIEPAVRGWKGTANTLIGFVEKWVGTFDGIKLEEGDVDITEQNVDKYLMRIDQQIAGLIDTEDSHERLWSATERVIGRGIDKSSSGAEKALLDGLEAVEGQINTLAKENTECKQDLERLSKKRTLDRIKTGELLVEVIYRGFNNLWEGVKKWWQKATPKNWKSKT